MNLQQITRQIIVTMLQNWWIGLIYKGLEQFFFILMAELIKPSAWVVV